jgi:threonine aldolase
VQANGVFASLPGAAIEPLRAALPGELPFYVWDEERGIVRLMCSWDTTEEDVDGLAAAIAAAVSRA